MFRPRHEAPLTSAELDHAWPHGTPLWFYILKEAQHRGDGDRLGPVGGRIVAEVLIGLLRADPASYLAREPSWTPTLPATGPAFGLADLLALSMEDRHGRCGISESRKDGHVVPEAGLHRR